MCAQEINGARIQGIYATDASEEAFRSAILAGTELFADELID